MSKAKAFIGFLLLFNILTIACGLFEKCDFKMNLNIGQVYTFNSSNYPNYYGRSISSCRWTAYAPGGYIVAYSCYVDIPCETDTLLVSRIGDVYKNEQECGTKFYEADSLDNIGVIGLIIGSASKGGRFQCNLSAVKRDCTCGKQNKNRMTPYIVGGIETNINEFPMLGALVDLRKRSIFCGCTLIGKYHCLTSAHCTKFTTESNTALLLGDHDYTIGTDTPYSRLYVVKRFKIHSEFSETSMNNDIALVETVDKIEFNLGISPACLPFRYQWNDMAGKTVELVGWGTLSFGGEVSEVPKKVAVTVESQTICSQKMPNIVKEKLCTFTKGKDACQYDSGGPVAYSDSRGISYILGIISYGKGCASSSGINTRVTSYISWIKSNTASESYCYM